MKEERMMILSMLKEGKINSEEAVKLLEALGDTEDDIEDKKSEKDKFIDMDKTKEKMGEFGEVVKEQGKKVGDIGVDLGNKIAKAFTNIKDDINLDGFLGNSETINTKAVKNISHIENPIIDLKSINGSIILENWDEEDMLIEINCKYKDDLLSSGEEFYEFYETENKIIFKPKFESKIMMNLKVYLPDRPYEEICLNTSNGELRIDDFNVDNLILNTTNAAITVNDILAHEINMNTKNGKFSLEDIDANIVKASTSNASITVDDIKAETFHINTKNGRISVSDILTQDIIAITSNSTIDINDISSQDIILTTSNGKILLRDVDTDKAEHIELSTSNASIEAELDEINKEIYIDLETSMGNINLEIENLVHEINKQVNFGKKKIVAHSINLNEEEEHLKLYASTSNASIKIY